MAKKKVRKQDFLDAIKATGGKVTGVCEMLDITRPTFYRYLEEDAELSEAVEFARVRLFDRAEYKLAEAVERGESWAVTLALKGHKAGRERGYGDNVDVTSNGETIIVTIKGVDES